METTNGYEFRLIEQEDGTYDIVIDDLAQDDSFVVQGMTAREMMEWASLLIQAAEAQEGE